MQKLPCAPLMLSCLILGFNASVVAAEPNGTKDPSSASFAGKIIQTDTATQTCLNDLRAFNVKIDKEGSWLGGSIYGFGYPAFGWGYGYGYSYSRTVDRPAAEIGYQSARPGYEVRALLLAANILAQHGKQQPCEDVLATADNVYKQYVADTRDEGRQMIDGPSWRRQQIADAASLTDKRGSIRSDELLGSEIRNQKDEALGSVSDLVVSPTTGRIAYLIVARGGIFGLNQKYVPVPWGDIKATPNLNMLVVDATKATMDAAPEVKHNGFAAAGEFDQMSQQVELFWSSHLPSKIRD